jgi:hypothetical protein
MKVIKTISVLMLIGLFFTACNKDKSDGGITKLSYSDQTFTGKLDNGEIISDLSWAWSSNMACFVETVKDQYKGNHVFYKIEIPTNSTIDIYMTPTNSSDEMALYGYSKATGDETIPPGISSSVSCEASPSNSNGAKTGEQHIYLNAINNPYAIIFGVAGPEGSTSGGFEIKIDVEN